MSSCDPSCAGTGPPVNPIRPAHSASESRAKPPPIPVLPEDRVGSQDPFGQKPNTAETDAPLGCDSEKLDAPIEYDSEREPEGIAAPADNLSGRSRPFSGMTLSEIVLSKIILLGMTLPEIIRSGVTCRKQDDPVSTAL